MKRGLSIILLVCLLASAAVPALAEGFSNDADAIERAAASVLKLYIYNDRGQEIATGSGFAAMDGETVFTNYHVIKNAKRIVGVSDGGVKYEMAGVLCTDKKLDIAVLSFGRPSGLAPLPLNGEADLKRGEKIVAIGSPIGIRNTVSTGNISALYEEDSVPWIQFTAPISPGSSGGALLNGAGEVIGITPASYTEGQNLNLAVNIAAAIQLYRQWNGKTLPLGGKNTGVTEISQGSAISAVTTYVVNTQSKKFHTPSCKTGAKTKQENKALFTGTREELLRQGYTPCGVCHP